MLTSPLFPLFVFVLASTSVGGVMLAILYPHVAKASAYKQRFERIAALTDRNTAESVDEDGRDRRRFVEKTLRCCDR